MGRDSKKETEEGCMETGERERESRGRRGPEIGQ